MNTHAHLVTLSPRTGKHGSFVPEHVGYKSFQPIHSRIFPHDVIANFGSHHGLQHCRRGSGDGIAAKINDS
jgi:hypothetical protein